MDDDTSVAKALARALRVRGFQIRDYRLAREFLAALPNGSPACLIVDLQMPDMTGLELLQHLKRNKIGIPAIVVTAHGDPDTCERCRLAGAVAVLAKPWRKEALFAAIASVTRAPDSKKE